MMYFYFGIAFPVCLLASAVSENSPEKSKITYERLYELGVDAYLQNRWFDCISYIEKSLEDYFYYRLVLIQCRSRCQGHKIFINDSDSALERNELKFFESIVKKALCLAKCERSNLRDRKPPSKSVEKSFESKIPYNYLQLCYYKVENIEKAASCAYTFLIHNPDHQVMQTNLKYYLNMPKIDVDKIQNLEAEDYQELYLQAAHLYTEQKYDTVIELMEKALKEYLLAEERCRLMCDEPVFDAVHAEIHVIIAHLFTLSLNCKLDCQEKLSYLYGQKHGPILASSYHYLQYSYYKVGQMKEACEAVASYLHLHPEDKIMLSNKAYYSKLEGVQSEWFSPREEAVEYQARLSEERSIMRMIANLFLDGKQVPDKMQFPTPPPGSPHHPHVTKENKALVRRERMPAADTKRWLKSISVSVLKKAKDLNGTERAAFRGLATEEECNKLINLANEGAVFGDGYNGKESPHTEFEMFEGLTVARAATLSQRGILNPESVQLFLDVSEKARKVVENYFDLETELYFAYTHLVCRTAFPDSPADRDDLSHPVHADNCILTADGDCLKELPAYTWRDYSSIVYLNEDFEGGEFIFAKDKMAVQASVKPKCGLMVAFSAGKENLHGVKAVTRGRRCALAMWYTLDERHRELERDFARNLVTELIDKRRLLKKAWGSPASKQYKESVLERFTGLTEEMLEKIERSHEHTEL